MQFHLVSINCRYSHSCLAQFYLRNELERHLPDCTVVLSQYTINDPYYQTLLQLTSTPCCAVFFSVYIWNHHLVRRLLADLAGIAPDLPVILGGPQAISLGRLPGQCTVVQGEIEGVPGSFYRDLAEGKLQPHYRAVASNEFPSPYTTADFSGPLNNRQLYYESSRGCPFFCSYCLSSVSRGVRHKSLELVRRELADLLADRPMIIKFVDRTFNDSPGRALEIWQYLVEQGRSVKCHFEVAPDRFSEEMFAFLGQVPSDLFQFEIGLQSCNPDTLKAVRRTMEVKTAGANIRRLVAMDTIHIHVDLILGLPFETGESFRSSFNRVFDFAPHYIQLGLLKVLPGTEIAERAVEYGIVHCSEPPYEVLATRWLRHAELRNLYEFCECVESFYNNRFFRSLWMYLRHTEEEPFTFFSGLVRLCRERNFFHLARTHALMNSLLVAYIQLRQDRDLLLELLCYDWLRCGHRTLPGYLEQVSQKDLRNRLRLSLPQELAGVYRHHLRVEFLKQATFLELSPQAVELLEPEHSGPALVAFLPEQTTGVMKFCTTVILPAGGAS